MSVDSARGWRMAADRTAARRSVGGIARGESSASFLDATTTATDIGRRVLVIRAARWAIGGGLSAAGLAARAASTLRLIVPFPPGGSADILARAVAARLGPALDSSVVIENRPGAGGSLGATEAARAAPDGATLLMAHVGVLAVNPALYPKLGYDPVKSFAPVAWVARVPNVLVVNANSPIRTLAELIARAKAEPGRPAEPFVRRQRARAAAALASDALRRQPGVSGWFKAPVIELQRRLSS